MAISQSYDQLLKIKNCNTSDLFNVDNNVNALSCEKMLYSDMWFKETLDMSWEVGFYSSIDIDDNDIPSIAYYDIRNGDLKVITQESNSWVRYTVDDSGDVGKYASLASDSLGFMHIAYYDATLEDLKYAKENELGWDIQTLASDGNVGLDCSLALDGNDHPHISFLDKTNNILKYISFEGTEWVTEVVDDTLGSGHGSSIVVSSPGVVFISYFNYFDDCLYCASCLDSGWKIDCADDKSSVYASTSIDVDSKGNPHICYFDVPSTTDDWSLRYAKNTEGNWVLDVIDPKVQYFWNDWGCSLCIDRFDRVHVGYYKWKNWDLNYALKCDDTWIIESVDTDGSVGAFASIAVNSLGYPHIGYVDLNNMALKYAMKLQFAPNRPSPPVGKKSGFRNNEYEYRVVTTDFDSDQVRYCMDWGDGSEVEWSDLYPSDTEVKLSHTWVSSGTFDLRVKAVDSNGFESPWSEESRVFMPKHMCQYLSLLSNSPNSLISFRSASEPNPRSLNIFFISRFHCTFWC